jgi:TolB-like protein
MVAALAGIDAGGNVVSESTQTPIRTVKRLVAIPLRVLRPDPETVFLAFSLPDAAAMSISGRQSLVVRSTHAASAYADRPLDPAAIARELDVDAVLSGTLVRDRGRVRVNAQVMEVPQGTVLWSRQLEGTLDDLFALEDSLAGSLAASVEGTLSAAGDDVATRAMAVPGGAYRKFLRANEIRYSAVRPTALMEARNLYREVVEEDPAMADAWARLGRIHRIIAKYGHGDADANRELARTHGADPDPFAGLVATLRFCGLPNASIAAWERVRSLDPAKPTSVHHSFHLAAVWARAAELDRDEPLVIRHICWEHLGRVDETRAALAAAKDVAGVEGMMAGATLAAIEGDREECARWMRQIEAVNVSDPEAIALGAMVAATAGLVDECVRLIEWSVSRGYGGAKPLANDPWFASMRGLPAFKAVMEKAGRAMFRLVGGVELLGVGGEG